VNQATLNQWLESIRNMNYETQKNIQQAEAYLEALNSDSGNNFSEYYQSIQVELEKARINLLRTLNYQREVLKEVAND
jgi:hypothetical protein